MTSDEKRERLIQELVLAWVKAGREPTYHYRQKRRLVTEWKPLYDAVDNLVRFETERDER